jgi:CO/xanthine dehydrogenase Mo-binding subunit
VGRYPVRVDVLNATARGADRFDMDRLETETDALRDQALALAAELGVDPASWYLRVLEEGRASDVEADLGALVRTYWELQRLTGRSDLRAEWRSLADRLWQDA